MGLGRRIGGIRKVGRSNGSRAPRESRRDYAKSRHEIRFMMG